MAKALAAVGIQPEQRSSGLAPLGARLPWRLADLDQPKPPATCANLAVVRERHARYAICRASSDRWRADGAAELPAPVVAAALVESLQTSHGAAPGNPCWTVKDSSSEGPHLIAIGVDSAAARLVIGGDYITTERAPAWSHRTPARRDDFNTGRK